MRTSRELIETLQMTNTKRASGLSALGRDGADLATQSLGFVAQLFCNEAAAPPRFTIARQSAKQFSLVASGFQQFDLFLKVSHDAVPFDWGGSATGLSVTDRCLGRAVIVDC